MKKIVLVILNILVGTVWRIPKAAYDQVIFMCKGINCFQVGLGQLTTPNMHCKTGSSIEYSTIEETIFPEVLDIIT